jgi:hypothetical protein
VGYIVWLELNGYKIHGLDKNIKDLSYGPSEVLKKEGNDSYKVSLPPYMLIYSIINVKNLKNL